MQLYKVVLVLQTWAAMVGAQFSNTSRQFHLHTDLKPGQTGREAFNNLWLYSYHTGAGTNDAMLSGNKSHALRGSLNASDFHSPKGQALYGLNFDLNTPNIPWKMEPDRGANTYAAWQPVSIDTGYAVAADYSAFWMDNDGLQWTDSAGGGSAEGFGGWLGKWFFETERR